MPAVVAQLERGVGRRRYAEDSQVLAARINLHEHTIVNGTGVILQPFVRTRQHEFNIDQVTL